MLLKICALVLCLLAATTLAQVPTVAVVTTDNFFETTTAEPDTQETTTEEITTTTTTTAAATCVVDANGNYIPDGTGLCTCANTLAFAVKLNAFWLSLVCKSCVSLNPAVKIVVCAAPTTTTTTTSTTTTTTTSTTTTTTTATSKTTTTSTSTTTTTSSSTTTTTSSSVTADPGEGGLCPGSYVCRCKVNARLIWLFDEFGCASCRCEWLAGYEPSTTTTFGAPTTTRTTAARTRGTVAPPTTVRTTATTTTTTARTPVRTTTRPVAVTTRAPLPPVIVPNAWNTFNGYQYRFFESELSWFEAEIACRNQNSELASVHSPEELKYVFKVAGEDELRSVWLGAILSRGGWFLWRDETAWDFDSWAVGEPDSNEKSGCVYFGHKANGHKSDWFNGACAKSHAFVCKRIAW